jgi:hypothetical protein
MNTLTSKLAALLLSLLLISLSASARQATSNQKCGQALGGLLKTGVVKHYTYFTINNIFSQYANNLWGAVDMVSEQASGFEWPKGSNKYAIYQDGLVYGGYYRGINSFAQTVARKFVNGSAYITSMTEGSITQYGTGKEPPDALYQNPADASVRVFRARPDINPYGNASQADMVAKLQQEEAILIQRRKNLSAQAIYDQYVKDWNEWPATKGAPFNDVNGNGTYDPQVDIPGIPDADQTLWMVCNDMVQAKTQNLAGGGPTGIEMQRTVWGYNRAGSLGNTLFMRYRMINKSGAPIDTMFVALWSDPDLGYAGDDYSGCDVQRSLAYSYNGHATDQVYGSAPPAVGYTIVQGPLVAGAANDSGFFDMNYRKGKKNLGINAFHIFI